MRISKKEFKAALQQIACEDRFGDLFLYADDPKNLDDQKRLWLERHLHECSHCRKELDYARSYLHEASQQPVPDWVRALADSFQRQNEPAQVLTQEKSERTTEIKFGDRERRMSDRLRALGEAIKAPWVSRAWRPHFAGMVVTAGDISTQSHVFRAPEGDIRIACRWRRATEDKPAYICLSWRASIRTKKELYARFTNPQTDEVLAEVHLGSRLEGEITMNSIKLGFDPSSTPWNMQLVLD